MNVLFLLLLVGTSASSGASSRHKLYDLLFVRHNLATEQSIGDGFLDVTCESSTSCEITMVLPNETANQIAHDFRDNPTLLASVAVQTGEKLSRLCHMAAQAISNNLRVPNVVPRITFPRPSVIRLEFQNPSTLVPQPFDALLVQITCPIQAFIK